MKKNYVLDTNVLLHDPHAIFRFEDNNVIIPIYVIEEVDQFKREGSERGPQRPLDRAPARRAPRAGRLAVQGGPARLGRNAARRRARASGSTLPSAIDHTAMDQAILQTAFDVRENDGGRADDLRHDGHEPAHPRRRARDGRADLREPARRVRPADQRDHRPRGGRRGGRHVLPRGPRRASRARARRPTRAC